MVNRGEEKVRVHINVVPRRGFDSHWGQKIFSLPRVVPCFPLLGLTPSGLFMGLSSTLIYTSELILCSTICFPSATLHNIHMYPYEEYWAEQSARPYKAFDATAVGGVSKECQSFI